MRSAAPTVTAGTILQLIRDGEAGSRADVARLTGLSRTAVAARVDPLIEAGLVSEADAPGIGVGRPPKRLTFEAGAGLVLAAAIGRSRAQFTVCDLSGLVLGSDELDQEVGQGPDDVLPRAVGRLRALLRKVGLDPADVLGIGVSIPGTVDPVAGTSLNSAIMRGWDGVPIAPYFAALSSSPVVIENDTNAIALAELDAHLTRYRDALIVKASTGLGAGIVAGGVLQHGARGAAGDIGHVKYRGAHDLPCRCGETGCLEAVAGGWALVRDLAAQGREVAHVRDVVRLALEGDVVARRAIRGSGQAIGEVLASAVTLLDPAVIVVGGDMAPAYDLLVAGLRETLYRDATTVAARDLDVLAASHGADSGTRGTAVLALRRVLSPSAVDDRLRLTPSRLVPS
ncbi:ROK family transcriptional regulator [Kineosporia sp. J2-2]|uniref:ROK family transcriptional regulator n=1 Tax=Kineosporia corallincola TaxID=2835133 RepID=A0ABS5TNZ4_9ACTN|nr:ROK family transcriptional regulator [Kineosporia corallincola]MBT0772820.1 ROK family transcriptional regulator [Kineosporia corallincola]